MGYYSDFADTITTEFDAERNETELLAMAPSISLGPSEIRQAFRFDADNDIDVSADGWRWYGFEGDIRVIAERLAKVGAQPDGEVFVTGEDRDDLWNRFGRTNEQVVDEWNAESTDGTERAEPVCDVTIIEA